ncbi:hypothetical protein [Mycobacterium sp. SMC-17]|uniref:hypothetical protein n=1 Tax=Mycobacterium sp. SMC-17 TaxID=3381628 RepID=UPI003876FCBD
MLTPGTELHLKAKIWRVMGELPGADPAGFGKPYVVEDEAGTQAVAKLVDKAPGADRELLVGAALKAAKYRNVIPVLDYGEHADQWVLVMPRAEKSLKAHLESQSNDQNLWMSLGEAA